MRMTNKIMRNNAAYNVNQNKILQDKLTNQMTNQSKIVRPSDDPVVAIRALRLRSNVTAVTQYNEKNSKDADQWLALTADAMTTVDETLTNLYDQANTSANKYNTASELKILISQMKELTEGFYECANVDYAGRFVFSGYRTDLPVTFTKEDIKEFQEHPVSFNIDESFGFQDISRVSYTDYAKVEENLTNLTAPGDINSTNSYEQNVSNNTMYRFRLSYNALDSLGTVDSAGKSVGRELTLDLPDGRRLTAEAQVDADGKPVQAANGQLSLAVKTEERQADGTYADVSADATKAISFQEFANQEAAYKAIADGKLPGGTDFDGIAYIPSSGELVFSKSFYDANLNEAIFNGNPKGFSVNYDKSDWKNGDINPVHYFQCEETKTVSDPDAADVKTRVTAYNTQRPERDQDIFYDVGYNQQIQVNTRADEIFTHDVQRDLDDFEYYLKQFEDIETLEKNLETKRGGCAETDPEYKDLTLRLEGVKKAKTYIRDNIHTKFENQITKYQKYMDNSRVAMTDNATRRSRLELVQSRLTNQQSTFKELQQDNEGIDITEVAIEMTSADMVYNAALMATGKIMKTNLMNYI